MAESPIGCLAAVHAAAAMPQVMAVEFHSADVPWWRDIVLGLADPFVEDGFIRVPQGPGLGIEGLNDELIAQKLHRDIPGMWSDTGEWDLEWSNDRLWS